MIISLWWKYTSDIVAQVVIPGGTGLTMSPASGQLSYPWTVNAARGTSMIFFMTDSQGRQGGSSDLRSVGASDDTSCLDNTSPSTTIGAPSSTQTTTGAKPSSPGAPPSPISAASIAGAIIGSVLFLAVAITLALFFLKRMPDKGSKTQISPRVDLTDGDTGHHMHHHDSSSLSYPLPHPPNRRMDSGSSPGHFSPSDFKYPASESSFSDSTAPPPPPPALYPPQPYHSYSPQSQYASANSPTSPSLQDGDKFSYYTKPTWTPDEHPSEWENSATKPKAAFLGMPSQLPSRYVMHPDAEEPSPYEGAYIESPPQYFERQGSGGFNSSVGYTYDTKHPL